MDEEAAQTAPVVVGVVVSGQEDESSSSIKGEEGQNVPPTLPPNKPTLPPLDSSKAAALPPFRIPFTRESPYAQEEISISYAYVQELSKMLKSVVLKAEQANEASEELARREADLARELGAFRSLCGYHDGHHLASACVSMSDALHELHETREIARRGMMESFIKPLRNLNAEVLKPATAHVNDMVKTRSDYLAAFDKFLATKTNKKAAPSGNSARDVRAQATAAANHASYLSRKRERYAALTRASKVYEMSRCELTHALNRAHATSQLDVAETVISTLYTQLSFHHQCHEIFEQRKASMRHLQKEIADARGIQRGTQLMRKR